MPRPEHRAPEAAADVRHQAALWLLELQADGDNPELRARWQHWHDASPAHSQAWARIEAFGASLRGMPGNLAQAALTPKKPRRRALKTMAVLLGAGSAGWIALDHPRLPGLLASQRTCRGEHRQLTLDDGSQITLNVDTALDVHFDAQARRLVLHAGEIHIATAADPAGRPFFVDTPHGRAQALGTRYSVRTDAESGSHVAVYAGAVAIHPRLADEGARRILTAGQQASFDANAVGTTTPANEADSAWTRGILVAEDMPLPVFTAEFARQSGLRLHCDPALAKLKVSGTYPLAEPERVLNLLSTALPVKVQRLQRWWGGTAYEILPA